MRVSSLGLVLVLGVVGCDKLRDVAENLLDSRPPREKYLAALNGAGLATSALALDWVAAGERSLREAPLVTSPHEEQGYLEPSEPSAIAMRIRVRRGQQITLEFDLPGDTATTLFLDAWSLDGDSADTDGPFEHLVSADSGARRLELKPRRDGEVIVRAQPELLRGGRFRVSVRLAPTLAFPVRPGTERDIGSKFGAPRDAGARSHHGIDIFARRGTPVVAASGVVSRANETDIGGKVIWVRDVYGNSLYYAHLDSQSVSSGMAVELGDTLGFVGNTGNARTTPPHLHFGVYRRGEGPVDPYWFLHKPRGTVPRLVADTSRLGDWIRLGRTRATLRAGPSVAADSLSQLDAHTALRVLSAAGDFYRVRLPDGRTGFVSAKLTERAVGIIATVSSSGTILSRPRLSHNTEDILAIVDDGEPMGVLARFREFVLVRSAGGITGWMLQQ